MSMEVWGGGGQGFMLGLFTDISHLLRTEPITPQILSEKMAEQTELIDELYFNQFPDDL